MTIDKAEKKWECFVMLSVRAEYVVVDRLERSKVSICQESETNFASQALIASCSRDMQLAFIMINRQSVDWTERTAPLYLELHCPNGKPP